MKFKLLLVAFIGCFALNAQTVKPEPIYEITIFKWAVDKDSVAQDVVLTIKTDGGVNIVERNDGDDEKLNAFDKVFNVKNIQTAFFDFINSQKIEKRPAYTEEEMGQAVEPEPGRQTLHITVVTVRDNNNVDGKDYPAEFFKVLEADVNDHAPKELFRHFGKAEAALLTKYLYPAK